MSEKHRIRIGLLAGLASLCLVGCGSGESVDAAPEDQAATPDRSAVNKLIQSYPARPQVAAQMMLAKYGLPREASAESLIWHHEGPFKRIMVTRAELHHDFPKPHMDFLEHTINYRVPSDKATTLVQYDGSVTLNRTAGEMSARCDLEGHNILTLNLAHDIVTGKDERRGRAQEFR